MALVTASLLRFTKELKTYTHASHTHTDHSRCHRVGRALHRVFLEDGGAGHDPDAVSDAFEALMVRL